MLDRESELEGALKASITTQEKMIDSIKDLGKRAGVSPTDLQLTIDHYAKYLKFLKGILKG